MLEAGSFEPDFIEQGRVTKLADGGSGGPVCRVLPLSWVAHTPAGSDDCCALQGGLPSPSASTGVVGWEKQPELEGPELEGPNLRVTAWLLRAGRESDPREESTADRPTPHTQILGMAEPKVGYGPESQPGGVLPVSGKASLPRGETWVNSPSPCLWPLGILPNTSHTWGQDGARVVQAMQVLGPAPRGHGGQAERNKGVLTAQEELG